MEISHYCSDRNRISEGNRVELLDEGGRTFERMLESIAAARKFVSLATFIFSRDGTGRRFRDALVAAAGRGVEVRVIVDGVGTLDTPRRFFTPLVRAGGELLVYHPVDPWRLKLVLFHRMHRKNLVVDGTVAYCGGINIHDAPLAVEEGGDGWHDIHALVEGPAVRDLHRSFLNTWIRVLGPPGSAHELLPRVEAAGDHCVLVNSAGGKRRGRRRRLIQREYRHAIGRARRSIHIWNPYFIPDRGVRRALSNACERGVDVRVILPERGNHPAVQLASQNLYSKLMRSGVNLHAWPGTLMHAKSAVIDSTWSTVGSYNMDAQSHLHNLELTVTVYGEKVGEALEAMFQRDLAACNQIDPDVWEYRPLSDRILQKFCYLFRRWL
jgi:cardiolipin synthase